MAAAQPWWKRSSSEKPVKAWTPDPNRYHAPDEIESMRMGMGHTGAAMIPRANNDGTSRGFDASRAGVFTVDPDKRGGGITIDPAMMTNDAIQDALARVGPVGGSEEEEQENAFAALTLIGQGGAETDPDRAVVVGEADENARRRGRNGGNGRPQSHRPRPTQPRHLEPVNDIRETRLEQPEPAESVEPAEQPEQFQAQATETTEIPEIEEPIVPQASPPRPSPARVKQAADPSTQSVQLTQAQAGAMLQQLMNRLLVAQPAAAAPPRQPPRPAFRTTQVSPSSRRVMRPVAAQPPPESAYEEPDGDLDEELPEEPDYPLMRSQEAQEEPETYPETFEEPAEPLPPRRPASRAAPVVRRAAQQAVGRHAPPPAPDTLKSLEVPFLAAKAQKPSVRVVFDLGRHHGTSQARYHGVVEGAGCLILVYDNRYEDGVQYTPPNRDEPITVSVPSDNKRYQALSLGMQFNVGQLDFIVLTLSEDNAALPNDAHAGAGLSGEEQPV